MTKELFALAIPGVRGDVGAARNILRLRQHPDIAGVELFKAEWKEGEDDFRPKVDGLIDTIGKFRGERDGTPIILLEISAGGAIGEIATQERPEWVAANVLICARLQKGFNTLLSQHEVLDTFPAHANAVALFAENIEPVMTTDQRVRHLTMIPEFDEIVPVESMELEGATTFSIPETRTHLQSISAAVTTHAQVVINFAQSHM